MNATAGLTAVNALSEELKYVIFRRGKEKGMFLFNDGKFINSKITKMTADNKHGTMVSFKPSEKYLGHCQIPIDELIIWVRNLSYTIDESIDIRLHILKKGKEADTTMKFKRKNGFVDYLDILTEEKLVDPISIKGNIDEDTSIEVAFTYNPKNHEEKIDSFVNFINTVDGGVHVNAARFAVTSCLSKLSKTVLTEAEQKKFDINNEDCKSGLVMAINLFCPDPGFASQTKEKVSNDELFRPIRSFIQDKVYKYFRDNPKILKKIIDYLKKVVKARLEVDKIKKSDYAPADNFKEILLKNFSPASNNSGYRELYIVEGGSAKGNLVNARDSRYQAIFALKGVAMNTFGEKLTKVLDNDEFTALIQILGTGVGKDFNIKKLKYDKIIILTDSDIDGYNITSLVCVFFFIHMVEIVKAGLLYKGMAPLYMIKGNDRFAISRQDYFEQCLESKVRKVHIHDTNDKKLTTNGLRDFFTRNRTYVDILKSIYEYCYVHPDIIEFIARFRRESNFKKLLKKKFVELDFETENTISGPYAGAHQYLHMDIVFDDKIKQLEDMIFDTNDGELYFYLEENNNKIKMTIGAILMACKKYEPPVAERWKGLGSIPRDIFWETTLNPEKRTLIQLTIESIEKDLLEFRILHGSDAQLRRDLLDNYKHDKEDIDK